MEAERIPKITYPYTPLHRRETGRPRGDKGIRISDQTSKHAIFVEGAKNADEGRDIEALQLRRIESGQMNCFNRILPCKSRSPKQSLYSSDFGTKIVYTFIISLSWATCPVQLISLHFRVTVMSGEGYSF
jgi:hypothetical protein